MLVLALDTTTRAGSLALRRDDRLLEVFAGDGARTHAARLPGDLLACLARHGLRLAQVDLFAVAAGPGSFTGLRIGIATIQGLAFACGRSVVGVSALDALAYSTWRAGARGGGQAAAHPTRAPLVAAWMDAQRGEVYGSLYRPGAPRAPASPSGSPGDEVARPAVPGLAGLQVIAPASVGEPGIVLEGWRGLLADSGPATDAPGVEFVGDGAVAYASLLCEAAIPGIRLAARVPPLAPAIAEIAARAASEGAAVRPHALRPIYVRRPDAELARDRRLRSDEARSASDSPTSGRAGLSR